MKSIWGFLLSAKSAAIVVLFFLPFINVSCSSMVNIPVTGMELATGKQLEIKDPVNGGIRSRNLSPEPLAGAALGSAALGLLFGFFRGRTARVLNMLSGAAGLGFLLLLRNKMEQEVLAQGGGVIALNYEVGFWASLTLFGLIALVGMYAIVTPQPSQEPSRS